MHHQTVSPAPAEIATPLLELIRRKEAEVKRRLAAEREAAQAALVEAEQRGRETVAAAEVEGQRDGEAQYQVAVAAAECEAQATLARAQAEVEALQRTSPVQIEAAVARAVKIILDA
jgi:vacuolar-type H+-ATPase subunit H